MHVTDSDIEIHQSTTADNSSLEDRMSRLETMLANLTENLIGDSTQKHEPRHHNRLPSGSSVGSNPDDSRKHKRRQRSPSKSPNPLGYETNFPDEEFKVSIFEDVMFALFKSLEIFIDEQRDITRLVRHGRYLSEKAVADVPDTLVNFDRFIRSLAGRKGYHSFDNISELDKARFFNLEGYKEVRALKS